MNILNQKKKKLNLLVFLYIITLLFSSIVTILNGFNVNDSLSTMSYYSNSGEFSEENLDLSFKDDFDDIFIYSINGRNYLATYKTAEDLEVMKKGIDIQSKRSKSDYNPIIDGHGTGYALPSLEDLDSLIGKISLLGEVPEYGQKYRASADISTEIYFPTVGDQAMQGSCSAWANAYYAYGYLEAKDYGWDASSGNPDFLLSPAWAYNIIAAYDYGSIPYEVAQVLVDWGVPTLSAMPYDDMDVDSWGNEVAWRQAPYHRPLDYALITYVGPTTIDLIKSIIDSGTPVTIGIDAYQFNPGLDEGTMDFILSSDEYDPSGGLNHAQCFVGYDDAITEGSDVGAFRVVNSWGDSWMDEGYYWLTYDAFSEFAEVSGQVIMTFTDRDDYNPSLISTWEFNPAPTRMGDIVTLGVGPHGTPSDLLTPHYDYDTNNPFPDFMALDISDFLPYYTANNDEFFFLEIGSSMSTGTISSFLIERYIAGVLVETTYESIDIPQSTPGYARNTFMDFDHEISVRLEVPENPEIFETYLINATVQNLGLNDELDIELYLSLDGGVVNSATYPTLSAGTSETIDYLWTPMTYDTFNFTVFAPPVAGEYTEDNNFKYSLVTIKFFQDYTMTVGHPYTWIDASGGTDLMLGDDDYAAIPLPFDFSFYDQTFSTVYLCSNGYLSFTDTSPWQYNNIPFPSDDPSYHYMIAPFWDDIYPSTSGHIYVQSFSSYWVAEWQDISHISSDLIGSFQVVLHENGDIIFNYDYISYTGDGYTSGLNLGIDTRYYNSYQGLNDTTDDLSILFNLESLDHDLRVTLDTPSAPELGTSYSITAMVRNYGEHDESDINLYLYYDDVLVNSTFIPMLTIGESEILTYDWTPTTYRIYNLTTYAPPVIDETYSSNNRVERLIAIHPVKLFDGMFIDHTMTQLPYGSGPSRVSYSEISETMFHVEWQGDIGGMLIQGYWDVDANTRVMENAVGSSFGNGAHTAFWIFPDSSLGEIIPIGVDGEGDHNFIITGDFLYDLPGFGPVEVWELEDLTLPGGIAWYEKSTGILLYGNFPYSGGMSNYILDFVDTNAIFEYIFFDHDISVYLEVPLDGKVDNSYIINATVKNIGLNDEFDVELYLYLDEVLINSIIIPTLAVGTDQTIQYDWTPTEYRAYNFTAIAPPVPLESYLDNNRKTTIAHVIETELFDGLFIKHTYSSMGYVYNTNFTYTPYTSSLYHETFGIEYMGSHISYTWIVDALTRIMSGGSMFVDGAHTPAWIFTSTSLYDTIPIAVDGEGDNDFYVARELVYDLPGFGLIEVWELEDLTQPGGIAWYEKSTGILLNGTFIYAAGAYNYTLDFVDTNAILTIIDAPPGDFTLSSNAGVPDTDGIFDLTWTAASLANNYSVYRYSSFITEINGSLTLLADEITDLTLALSGYEDGTYYFIVVAHNNHGDTLSNCIEVNVELALLPGGFTLSSNAGVPDTDGIFDLTWTAASLTNNYSVYRSSSFITEIDGSLTLLADEITDLTLALTGYEDGTYYFIVVAHNNHGDTLSNCIEVNVELPAPPGDFTLSSNAGEPDTDGIFDLSWTAASLANNYSVYRSSSFITEIDGSLTLLANEITDLNHALSGYEDGTYYFIVVAHNNYGDTLSNCIEITVEKTIVLGYDLALILLTMLGITFLIIKPKLKRNSKLKP
ncbi:MAG: CARDB domain-containing protein [Promethearchaeota archaeon]